jgi:hypothetical protein
VAKCASAREKQSKSEVVVRRISSLNSNHSHSILTLHKAGFTPTSSNFLFGSSLLLLLLFIVYYFGVDSCEEIVRNFVVVVNSLVMLRNMWNKNYKN